MLPAATKFLVLIILLITLRCIEAASRLRELPTDKRFLEDVSILYHIGYLHLSLCMAAVGLLWDHASRETDAGTFAPFISILFVLLFAFIGCIFRGLVSSGAPETVSRKDKDWVSGIIVPDMLGFAALILAILWVNLE